CVECPTDCTVCSFMSDGEIKCLTCKDRFILSCTSDSCLNNAYGQRRSRDKIVAQIEIVTITASRRE
ncbi:hypothetical protein LSAT2_010266, partial [Lamellibrachia satsuma]